MSHILHKRSLKHFSGLSALILGLSIGQYAQAELIIYNTQDASGQARMIVSDDTQKELPPAQLGISPARIEANVSLSQGSGSSALNQSLTLYNYGNKPKKVVLNLVDIDETGSAIAPSPSTLKPWTLINPTQFTIPANGYQTIRLSIRPPVTFKKGRHSAMLVIEQQVDNPLIYDADGRGVTVEIGSRYGLPIRINVK